MFAYIRYHDTPNNKHIVPTSSFEEFDASEASSNKCYFVWWPPKDAEGISTKNQDSDDEEGYFPAQMILVKDSREAILERVKAGRIPIPKLPEVPDRSDQANNPVDKQSRTKTVKVNMNAAAKRDLTAILEDRCKRKRKNPIIEEADSDSSDDDDSSNDELVPKKMLKKTEAEVAFWKKKCIRLRELNEKLQEALTASVLKADERMPSTLPNSNPIPNNLAKKTPNLPNKQSTPESSNINPSAVTPSPIPTNPSMHCDTNLQSLTAQSPSNMITENEAGGIVNVGGYDIPYAKWKHILLTAKNPSIFCKYLAVILWDPDILKKRSITGMTCNANKAKNAENDVKQALTPKKFEAITSAAHYFLAKKGMEGLQASILEKNVKNYLKEKISDLNRKK